MAIIHRCCIPSLLLFSRYLFQSDAVRVSSSLVAFHDGLESGMPASPDCWLQALRTTEIDATSTADACNWMTTQYQKILALEMANCHVQDLGRTLFEDESADYPDATCSHGTYREHLATCLTRLTPSAETAYTHFLTYINQLCTRLSREVVMDHFYETSVKLAKVSEETERQFKDMLQHQVKLMESWNAREQETASFHDRFREDVYQERVRWAQESSMMRSQWQQEQEEWYLQRQEHQKSQMVEIDGQQRELRRQKDEIALLSETVARANRSIQPWSLSLQNMYSYAQNAYHALIWVLHLTGNTIIMGIFTIPQCLRWLRRYMLMWIITGVLIEAMLIFSLQQGDPSFSYADIVEIWSLIRGAMYALQVIFYLLGALISPCFRSEKHPVMVRPKDDDQERSLPPDDYSMTASSRRPVPNPQVYHESSSDIDSIPRLQWQPGQNHFERLVHHPVPIVNPSPFQPALTSAFHSQQVSTNHLHPVPARHIAATPRQVPIEWLGTDESCFNTVPFVSIEKSNQESHMLSLRPLKGPQGESLDLGTENTVILCNDGEKISCRKRPFPAISTGTGGYQSPRSPKRPRLLDYNDGGVDDPNSTEDDDDDEKDENQSINSDGSDRED